jgi:glucose/arabinose dehydrogenase
VSLIDGVDNMRLVKTLIGLFCLGLLIAVPATAQDSVPNPPDPALYTWALISDGYDNPVGITYTPDESGRLFAWEQGGLIWVIDANGEVGFDPFLDISDRLPVGVFRGGYSEQGLLGLAFHPEYAENGLLFVHYSNQDGDTIIARYQVSENDPNAADPASGTPLLFVDQPFENHNGGQLAFGQDGYLYVGLGDGGSQGDPDNHAQTPDDLLGKILRIDVNTDVYVAPSDNPYSRDPAFAPEVWAMGLRNPWRFSFDRTTGDLYIADVGEWLWEEINFQSAESLGGENYGWSLFESRLARTENADAANYAQPIAEYSHMEGCSVSGGYVYRGAALPELNGVYFFGDYCSGRIWTTYRDADGAWQTNLFMETARQITSFGEDEAGELYLVDYKGEILRLEAVS